MGDKKLYWVALILLALGPQVALADDSPPDFALQVAPLLTKYCTGCHNAEDREGNLSLETFAELQEGIEEGPVILPGQADSSRLIRVLTGEAEPLMPPEDNEGPSEDEIAILRAWIDSGARGPDGDEPSRRRLITPRIEVATTSQSQPITALALSPNGRQLAVARFGRVDLIESLLQETTRSLRDVPGKINGVNFSPDGARLVIATGIAGLYGQANVYELQSGKIVQTFVGHRDAIYDAQFSPNGELLATCSYDHAVTIWNVASGEPIHTMTGHNGAVFDLCFSPDGTVLATASADETVKLWNVATGERLDTLGQPEAEQFCVTFSPEGRYVVAGGGDRRIRVWEWISRDKPQTNPMRFSRFAHDAPIVQLAFTPDGNTLISTAEDQFIKLWETERFADSVLLEPQPDVVTGLAVAASSQKAVVGRMDGSWQLYALPVRHPIDQAARPVVVAAGTRARSENDQNLTEVSEEEPNDDPAHAQRIALPARVKGLIHATGQGKGQDLDLFRFTAQAGENWIFETNAARQDSQLDSKIEVLDDAGGPIERVLLQAVRDSYITFVGRDSADSDGFRFPNWREMGINQYLYAGGDVMRLWMLPRGPDSGFMLYPGRSPRYSYFGTTALAHPLHEPAYIVQPHPPGTKLVTTGLPVFTLYYENDDDGQRKLGPDSRLEFRAPYDGEYLVRVSDVRALGGESYHYELLGSRPKPDFDVSLSLKSTTIHAGSGREFSVTVNRKDGFEGEVRIDIDGLPPGFHATTPVVVEAEQITAFGTINADENAPQPTPENAAGTKITAVAEIGGHPVTKEVTGFGELKLDDKSQVWVTILPPSHEHEGPDGDAVQNERGPSRPLEFVIAPGETISAIVQVERRGDFSERIPFGQATSGRNLPHGVYVDNIGLNGLLVPEGQDRREFFITAAPWVPETTRSFHLEAQIDTDSTGQETSWPVLLHVRRSDHTASR